MKQRTNAHDSTSTPMTSRLTFGRHRRLGNWMTFFQSWEGGVGKIGCGCGDDSCGGDDVDDDADLNTLLALIRTPPSPSSTAQDDGVPCRTCVTE